MACSQEFEHGVFVTESSQQRKRELGPGEWLKGHFHVAASISGTLICSFYSIGLDAAGFRSSVGRLCVAAPAALVASGKPRDQQRSLRGMALPQTGPRRALPTGAVPNSAIS